MSPDIEEALQKVVKVFNERVEAPPLVSVGPDVFPLAPAEKQGWCKCPPGASSPECPGNQPLTEAEQELVESIIAAACCERDTNGDGNCDRHPNGKPGRGVKEWLQVFTGGKVYPLDPKPEEIRIEDIARALSMQCRYAGHVQRFYSVAEHSVHVSRIIHARTGDARLSLWGLLHDASEAYLADIPRPLKHQPEMAPYRAAEKKMQAVISRRFGLPETEPEIVSAVDWEILGTEAVQLKSPVHPDWAKTTSTGTLPAPLPEIGNLGWYPEIAEPVFLSRFRALQERIRLEEQGLAAPAVIRAEVTP